MKINIWKTDFDIGISKYISDKLRKEVNGNPYSLFIKNVITKSCYYRMINGKTTNIKNYFNVISYFKICLKEAESNILYLTYRGSKQKYPFVKEFTLPMFRVVCHLIGDGTFPTNKTGRWIQKKENLFFFEKLLENLGINIKVAQHGTCNYLAIPQYFFKLFEQAHNINVSDIKNPKTLKKLLSLPQNYKLQLLAALLVDEGGFRYKKVRSCIISQANKEFMEIISTLLNHLNYEHSKIKEEIDQEGHVAYRINIYVQGVIKFSEDLKESIKNYKFDLNLWHKQKELESYLNSCATDSKYSKKEKELVVNLILDKLNKRRILSYEDFRRDTDIIQLLQNRSKRYLINRFYSLTKQKKIERISEGIYKPIDLRNKN